MKSYLLKTLLVLGFVFFYTSGLAQSDSANATTYDIVYLTKGGAVKGQILSFNEKEGSMVFKDLNNRTYSFSRKEYDYFVENQVLTEKKIKNIRARKDEGYEVSLGFCLETFSGPEYQYTSQNSGGTTQYYLLPISLKVGVGKYIEKQHFVGATASLGMLTEAKLYNNAGMRYAYIFTSDKRNAILYLPFEAKYFRMATNQSDSYSVNNVTEEKSFDLLVQSVGLSAGTGVSFIRADKKSISIEAKFTKHFTSELEISNVSEGMTVTSGEMRLASGSITLAYNF
ncbi:MAG: hypothetical protein ACPGTP_02740 [Bacteroidia bacterium]